MSDRIRDSFHSNDFGFNQPINGKKQEEHEADFGVVGEIAHLKELGWERYQWRYTKEDECKENNKVGKMCIAQGCFAEFFSLYFNGYLRGDGKTVKEAILKCLHKAQKFAACKNHEYLSKEGYTNGLIICKHCGFWGHTTMIKSLKDQIRHLTIQLEVEKEFNARNERDMKEKGKTSQELFCDTLEGMVKAFTDSQEDSTKHKEKNNE